MVCYKMIAALLIFFITLVTALYPLLKKSALKHIQPFELGEAFASGIFLGIAFFHMLPESIHIFANLDIAQTYPLPEIICLGGFLFLLLLERLALVNGAHGSHSHAHSIPYMLATILVIHALVEGAALGIGETVSETMVLLVAILAHKGSESFALCMALLRHHLSLRRIALILFFFALMTPIGIGLGATINEWTQAQYGKWAAGIYNAFAAGTFLYMSTLHHIRFHQHAEEAQGLQEFIWLAVGLSIMGIVAVWA